MTPAELRQAREGLGLTQDDFRKLLRVTERTVSRWEQGHVAIPGPTAVLVEALIAIAGLRRFLGIDWRQL